ncbi:MAG: helix-turn-helix domain-containing protein, partial [Oscillospiraceae bacterium]|nr:helix-turn-helix domain-containing protein [Oscillospiraceae bacterium]
MVRDKLLIDFSDMLLGCCMNSEKCIRLENYDFAVIGTEGYPYIIHTKFADRVLERYRTIFQDSLPMEQVSLCIMDTCVLADTLYQDALQKLRLRLDMHKNGTFPSEHYHELFELKIEIYRYPELDWSLEMCTKKLKLSAAYFQRLYRSTFNVSWSQDVRLSKMQYAKTLLMTTDEKLEGIAEKCGYEYAHFMRTFKATPHKARLSSWRHICLHLFRHLAQKFLAGRQPSGVISIQSDEKSGYASAPPALCGV